MKYSDCTYEVLFDTPHRFADTLLRSEQKVWDVVPKIHSFFDNQQNLLSFKRLSQNVWAEEGAVIEDLSCVQGRLLIGAGSVIKKNAILRDDVIIGRDCIIGYFVELKNTILFDTVHIPHLSYVGDSILGNCVHLGAGVKVSNFKSTADHINILFEDIKSPTNMLKLGAVCGDHVEVGCNAVLSPGTIIGQSTTVYPLVCVRGTVNANTIVKSDSVVAKY